MTELRWKEVFLSDRLNKLGHYLSLTQFSIPSEWLRQLCVVQSFRGPDSATPKAAVLLEGSASGRCDICTSTCAEERADVLGTECLVNT